MISIVVISKDESSLDTTLTDVSCQAETLSCPYEIVVVDASAGRLDYIRQQHSPPVRWIQFQRPQGVVVSIPHQRNVGVREANGDVIVFTDAGCRPEAGWLQGLVRPIFHDNEFVTAGPALAITGSVGPHRRAVDLAREFRYLPECPTLNMAFRRVVFDAVGGFDEHFAYGSDVDFSWRLADAGYRIRSASGAVIRHDWGSRRRQLKRSYVYGRARARLYMKHRLGLMQIVRRDPTVIAYPAFLLGLPLTIMFPLYPGLLLISVFRNRSDGPLGVVAGHLCFGAGVLVELISR